MSEGGGTLFGRKGRGYGEEVGVGQVREVDEGEVWVELGEKRRNGEEERGEKGVFGRRFGLWMEIWWESRG